MVLVLAAITGISAVIALTPPGHQNPASFPGIKQVRTVFNSSIDDLPWLLGALGLAALVSVRDLRLFPLLLSLFAAVVLFARRFQLGKREKLRAEQIAAELPVIVELLALSVSSGQSPASALKRVAAASSGPLGTALGRGVEELKNSGTLVTVLESVRNEMRNEQVERCINALILGYERGTSLGDVLHAQALDVREEYRRSLIERSAKAEIAMMLPVVFLIMPVTIIFALFPSLQALTSPY